jgi:acetolactate synthase-1/2/3 large subunit
VPVIGMESPRGVADPSLGAFAEVLAQADAVLLLGKRLDFTLKFGQAPSLDAAGPLGPGRCRGDEIDRTRRAVGDRLDATALADLGSASTPCAPWRPVAPPCRLVRRGAAALAWRPPHWATASSALPGRLHPAADAAPAAGTAGQPPRRGAGVRRRRNRPMGAGGAARTAAHRQRRGRLDRVGLPFALAARCAVAADVPVVAVMGDGTYGFHLAEFDTGVRYRCRWWWWSATTHAGTPSTRSS